MPSPSQDPTTIQALAAALRDVLGHQMSVTLPGLGTIRKAHRPARIEVDDEGRRVLLPPRESLAFEASDSSHPDGY